MGRVDVRVRPFGRSGCGRGSRACSSQPVVSPVVVISVAASSVKSHEPSPSAVSQMQRPLSSVQARAGAAASTIIAVAIIIRRSASCNIAVRSSRPPQIRTQPLHAEPTRLQTALGAFVHSIGFNQRTSPQRKRQRVVCSSYSHTKQISSGPSPLLIRLLPIAARSCGVHCPCSCCSRGRRPWHRPWAPARTRPGAGWWGEPVTVQPPLLASPWGRAIA